MFRFVESGGGFLTRLSVAAPVVTTDVAGFAYTFETAEAAERFGAAAGFSGVAEAFELGSWKKRLGTVEPNDDDFDQRCTCTFGLHRDGLGCPADVVVEP
jgi:hypothetical protein